VLTHQRLGEVESRNTFGHGEWHSVVGSGQSGKSTPVSNVSRGLCEAKVPAITVFEIVSPQLGRFFSLPAQPVAFVTTDYDLEFAFRYRLADLIGVAAYFCNPYWSFQQGTNEHFNGGFGRTLSKSTLMMSLGESLMSV